MPSNLIKTCIYLNVYILFSCKLQEQIEVKPSFYAPFFEYIQIHKRDF